MGTAWLLLLAAVLAWGIIGLGFALYLCFRVGRPRAGSEWVGFFLAICCWPVVLWQWRKVMRELRDEEDWL